MKKCKYESPFKEICEISFRVEGEQKMRNLNPKLIARKFMEQNYPEIKEWEWFIGTRCIFDNIYDETCFSGEYIITIYDTNLQ